MTKMKCCRMLLHSPHIFRLQTFCSGPPVPSKVLVFHIDSKARRSRRRCRRKPVLPSAPCVHKCTQLYIVHFTRFRASAHTIAPPMPRAPPPRHNVVPRQQSSPAQQHRIQLPVLAQVLAPTFLHTYHVLQMLLPTVYRPGHARFAKPVLQQARFRNSPPVHTRTSMPTQVLVSVIYPAYPPSFRSSNSVASPLPMKHDSCQLSCQHQLKHASCKKPTPTMRDLVTSRTPLPRYSDWFA